MKDRIFKNLHFKCKWHINHTIKKAFRKPKFSIEINTFEYSIMWKETPYDVNNLREKLII